ncbi:MAG: hypothetical protein FWD58_04070 [Firmicutes bacterium]|nr:hypothetical protein [Bacillota bacterium]
MSEPDNNSNEVLPELSKAKKTVIMIIVLSALALFIVALVLCGTGVFECELSAIWLPSAFLTLAFCFLSAGFIGKNPVSVWLGAAFLLAGMVGLLAGFDIFGLDKRLAGADGIGHADVFGYHRLYPLYIAIPAFASLITGAVFLKFKPHLRTIIFFGGISCIFWLQSFARVPWVVVLPILAGFVVLCVAYVVYKVYKYRNE